MQQTKKKPICIFTLSFFITLPVFAESSAIERIIVSSNRSVNHSADLHYKVTTESEVFDYNPAELFSRIPGINLNGQGGQFQSYSIRGMSRQRIRTEFDGIPIFTERRAGSSLSFIPIGFIGSVQAIKGPQATLYGQEAMGGIISLNRWQANQANLHYGFNQNGNANSVLFRTQHQQQHYALSYRQAQNSKAANGQSLHTEFSQFALLMSQQQQMDDFEINYSMVFSDNRDIGKSNRKYPSETTRYPSEKHLLSQVTLTHQTGWHWQAYQHYQNWDSEVQRANRETSSAYQSHTLGSILRLPWHVKGVNGQTGFEWIGRYGVNVTEQESGLVSRPVVNAQQDNAAIFTEMAFTQQALTFEIGSRFDILWQKSELNQIAKVRQQRFSGHAAIKVDLANNWQSYYKIADGFRYASLSERFFSGETPRGRTLGNPNLAAETAINQEIGIEYSAEKVGVQVAAYRNQIENYIERYRINSNLISFRNVDRGTLQGAEVSINWQMSSLWHNRFGMHWQQGWDQNQTPLADVSPAKFQHHLTYDNGLSQFALSSQYRIKKDRVAASETALPSTTIFDLYYRYRVVPQLTLALKINNLTNKLYLGSADQDADWQPGRQFQVDVNWTF